MTSIFLDVAALAVVSLPSLSWCFSLSRRLRRLGSLHHFDPLTGLRTGRCLDAERWPLALRSGRPLAVAYIDLDGLKARNDALGHEEGDRYIRTAAHALWASFPIDDEVFRLYSAGDEFIVLLHGALDPERLAADLPQRLKRFGVAASIGLAYCPEVRASEARAALRSAAERACRIAKSQGGDCVVAAPELREVSQPCRRKSHVAPPGDNKAPTGAASSGDTAGRVLEPVVDSATAVIAPERMSALVEQTADGLGVR